ncbi:sensor histidine kinase [Parageobacillus toebii]|uniref:sensor histidine kinase n=1 Tax=Parageobacillus toebii TaxID=153151 RepID=UPI002E25067B|nr:histidine kinase N-terminal domain-containing protein [Parageobacillus toebii]
MLEVSALASFLRKKDIKIIEEMSKYLQLFANLSQADVFIDCLLPGEEEAIVVAEAHPITGKSLYSKPVVGKIAYKENEPGVFFCFKTGKPVIGSRGVSQENVNMQQNVMPIQNELGKTIGVLIMEQDITEKIQQEKNVELLMETTEQLSETLYHVAMSEAAIPDLMHEGLLLFDRDYYITFANDRAKEMFEANGHLVGEKVDSLPFGSMIKEELDIQKGMFFHEFQSGKRFLQLKAVSIQRNNQTVGGVLLLRDLSELKEKEKQLMIKSAVIREIHHRVKNNLQTIASLLRLQMRRVDSQEVEKIFREIINRITSISIIHEILSLEGTDMIECREVIELVSNAIISSMKQSEQKITVHVDGCSLYLPSQKASSLALVINELVQNAINHAFVNRDEGVIRIYLKEQNQIVSLTVTDDGVGFDHEKAQQKGRLGLQICQTLISEDLEGILEFENNHPGTKVAITFPLPKEELMT